MLFVYCTNQSYNSGNIRVKGEKKSSKVSPTQKASTHTQLGSGEQLTLSKQQQQQKGRNDSIQEQQLLDIPPRECHHSIAAPRS